MLGCILPLLLAATALASDIETQTNEAWVLDKVKHGDKADLEERDKCTRVLSGDFLKRLLTGGYPEATKDRKEITIQHAVIMDPLDMRFQEVPYDVALWDCDFKGDVDFFKSVVKGLRLSGSSFYRAAKFRKMEVPGELRMTRARFLNPAAKVDFKGLISKDVADFTRAEFAGEASFSYSTLSVGDFTRAKFSSDARFLDVKADSALYFGQAEVWGRFSLRNTTVEGSCYLDRAKLHGNVDLENVQIKATLDLEEVQLPEPEQAHIKIDRLSYGAVTPVDDARRLTEVAEFSPDSYAKLEAYLRKRGEPESANEIGTRKSGRQRQASPWTAPSYWWSLFSGVFVGNGYYPQYALAWALLVVALGTLVFWPKSVMDGKPSTEGGRPLSKDEYNPLLYSLDLFVPGVDLGVAKSWMPRRTYRVRRLYMYAHRFLGWIVVPIGLIALTGIAKL
jgi:uncharacterized protein YjbI with pentapeptide repeats